MKFRSKEKDLDTLQRFIGLLETFKHKKHQEWEKLEVFVQSQNPVATPSEDWIIPPDTQQIEKVLREQSDYTRLREGIVEYTQRVQEIATFLEKKSSPPLEWLVFSDPLLGKEALEEALTYTKSLKRQCANTVYLRANLKRIFT